MRAVSPGEEKEDCCGKDLFICLRVKESQSMTGDNVDAGGSVAEWLACWTQAQKGPGSNRSSNAVG